MGKLSDKAFAVTAKCSKTKKPFGITVNPLSKRQFAFVWAFKMKEGQGEREGYENNHVKGAMIYDDDFNGCPYCHSRQFYLCSNCGKLSCYHGEIEVICPTCGTQSIVQAVEEIELAGGQF